MAAKSDVDTTLAPVLVRCCRDLVRFRIDSLIPINCFISLTSCVLIAFYNVKYARVYIFTLNIVQYCTMHVRTVYTTLVPDTELIINDSPI